MAGERKHDDASSKEHAHCRPHRGKLMRGGANCQSSRYVALYGARWKHVHNNFQRWDTFALAPCQLVSAHASCFSILMRHSWPQLDTREGMVHRWPERYLARQKAINCNFLRFGWLGTVNTTLPFFQKVLVARPIAEWEQCYNHEIVYGGTNEKDAR